MASRRRRVVSPGNPGGPNLNSPAQQDEADILAEVEASRDDDTGEMLADEEKIREVGAVDAESVRENRRIDDIVNKKRGGVAGVPFNTGDIPTKYETIIRSWPPNTLDISMRRLTGQPVTHMIMSRPRSGAELYEAIKTLHGPNVEANYEIRIFDNNSKVLRGQGQIVIPDARGPQQGQQPMYAPPPPPLGYPQQYAAPTSPGYPPQHVVQPPVAPPPAQSPFDPNSMMSMMGQMFEMFQRMQQPAPVVVQPAPPPAPPTMPQMPPMPSPQASPAEMMAWMQQAFTMFQQMQTHPPAQIQPTPVPVPAPAPVAPPPKSSMQEMREMLELFQMLQKMQNSGGSGSGLSGPPGYRGPGPRAPYYPQGEPPPYTPPREPPYVPPPRERTAAEQFREAMTVVRTAVDAVQEMNGLIPQPEQREAPVMAPEQDDSPVQVIDTGPAKIVVNKKDGTLRGWETGWANMDKVLKWVGEQHEQIQKASVERQLREQPPVQQLPPGYVEVGPGYQPPPGYVAVPVDQMSRQTSLPPPPTQMPPPIREPQEPRRTWGAPVIPTDGQE